MRYDRIIALLTEAFTPHELGVQDFSEEHHGHMAAGDETHFRVRMRAESLRGLSPVAQHRAVMRVLSKELETGLHALELDVSA